MSKHTRKKKIPCGDCDRTFTTGAGLANHARAAHPYIPPPPPARTTEVSAGIPSSHSLLNGDKLEIGDVFYRVEKHVAKRITKTEGTRTVQVESEITKQHWQKDQPS